MAPNRLSHTLASLCLLCGSFALVTLVSCGGINGVGGVPPAGRVTFTMVWPTPTTSNSVQVVIQQGSTLVDSRLLPRQAGGVPSVYFDSLPSGSLTATATAYSQADGTGTVLAIATLPVSLIAKQDTTFHLTLAGTIHHLDVTPGNLPLLVNDIKSITMTARDSANNTVLVAPSNVQWTSRNPLVATVDIFGSGIVIATGMGSTTIDVRELGSGKTASVPVGVLSVTAYVTSNPGVVRYDMPTDAFSGTFIGQDSGHALIFGADRMAYVSTANPTSQVRRYNQTTGAFIDIFVPTGSGGLDNATDLRFGPDGNLYVASAGTNDVKRYNATTGAYMGSFAFGSGLNVPTYIAFGPDGNLYVSSSGITSGVSEVKRYNGTTGAFIDNFVPSGSGGLSRPYALVFHSDGNLYVASYLTNQVLRYNGTTGAFIDVFVNTGVDGPVHPEGMAFGSNGDLYVVSSGSNELKQYRGTTGAFVRNIDPAGDARLNSPSHIVFH